MPPSVGIVIATHNKTERLERVLWSLCQQDRSDFTVVVANDAGTLATADLCASFADQLNITHIWATPPGTKPIGAGAARNRAIKLSAAPRILIIDDDCMAPMDLVSVHAALPRNKGAFGFRRHIAEEEQQKLTRATITTLPTLPYRKDCRDNAMTLHRIHKYIANSELSIRNYLWTCHVSYPRDTLLHIGGFWEEMAGSGHEDQEIAVRAFRSGLRFLFLPDTVVYHQDHKKCQLQSAHQHRNRVLLYETLNTGGVVCRRSFLTV